MTGNCCLGQCTQEGSCECRRTNVVDIYGSVCSSGTGCGSDCYCHPLTEEYKTVNLGETFTVSAEADSPYKWELIEYDKNYLGSSIGTVGCGVSPSGPTGKCTYSFQFEALKEGKTKIALNKIDINNNVIEVRYFHLTITTIPSICKDSDGGVNYYVRGITNPCPCSGELCPTCGAWIDKCLNKSTLLEYSCDNLNGEEYNCPNGCKDGACIKGKEPYCSAIGSRSEGWYQYDNLIKYDNCNGCYAVCMNVGSKSEGWYSSCTNELIKWEQCGEVPEKLTVKINSPTDGETVSGIVKVKATATGPNPVELGKMTLSIQKKGEPVAMVIPFKDCTGGIGCTPERCIQSITCQYDWDTSTYSGSVMLTVDVEDTKGNRASDTIGVNVLAPELSIKITSPTDGETVSRIVTVKAKASSPNGLNEMILSIQRKGESVVEATRFEKCAGGVACPVGGGNCTYVTYCEHEWNTTNYDGEVFLTASITDIKGNKATDSIKVTVINYQTCDEQCKSRGYKYGSCKTGCEVGEVNIGIDGCPQTCPTCPSGAVCPPCVVTSCCCASKKPCPYECCVNDPDYLDKPCPVVPCPVCEPGKECPPCIQPKCIDNRCVWYPQEEFVLKFKAGWNMFSFPVDIRSYLTATRSTAVAEATVENVITGHIAEIKPTEVTVVTVTIPTERECESPDHVWHYSNGRYIDVLKDPSSLVNGWGYWVKMKSDCIVKMRGNKITIDDFPELEIGWNQIGAPSEPVNFYSVIGDCNLLSGPWWFNSASRKYEKAQVLRPGEGYFIKVNDKCKLGSEIPPLPPEEASVISKASRIR
jgi:hypothetical protein